MADVIVAGAVVERGRVLLCHRCPDRPWYPNVWDLPGGHVERGETLSDALARELREELGITVHPKTDDPVEYLRTPHFEMSIWLVTVWEGVPVNLAPAEHDALGWFVDLVSMELAHQSYLDVLGRILTRS